MKRDRALVSLSHGHHQALVVAQKLRRAGRSGRRRRRGVPSPLSGPWPGVRTSVWRRRCCCRPSPPHGDPYHPLVAHVLCDHVAIRQRAEVVLDDADATVTDLRELGRLLADHVRLEERDCSR